jgi:hypothetical protein
LFRAIVALDEGRGAAAMRMLLHVFVCALWASPALADVERFAVLIGENRGAPDEATLQYADSDARKLRDVLLDLGGFSPANVVLLSGQNADAVRRTLITVNDRVRNSSGEAMLLVYYSGHADADALHLGDSRLAISEVEKLVRGSAADVRLLILDSCRSGSLTRVKGGTRGKPFAIELDESLAASGAVFLTSSAEGEDAQESDELKGSFFTHYLVSGLLGAADRNGDGKVVLSEAYRFAYEGTLRASSRTLAGTQHPTFRYDLSGKGDVLMTHPGAAARQRGALRFPSGRSYLVMAGSASGPVLAEVGASDATRKVSLRPGRYFVRGRGRDHLMEGVVDVSAGSERSVGDHMLQRTDYARLVRKGGGVLEQVSGPVAGFSMHTALSNSSRPCLGAFAGYVVERPGFDLASRISWCHSGFSNQTLSSSLDEAAASVRMGKSFDLPVVTAAPYLSVGGGLFSQRFESLGRAPSATTAFGRVQAGLDLQVELSAGLYLSGEIAVATYAYRQGAENELLPSVALASSLGLGWFL